MGNLVTSRSGRRRMQFWPVAEGQGRDGRRLNHSQGEARQAEETHEVIVRLPTVAHERRT